ncbi:MAG: PAS domain-containing protein [Polyangiales bacterium]
MNDPRRAPDDADPLLRAVFDALPVGIVYLDAALTLVRANPAALRAFALRAEDLGRPFFEVTGLSPSLAPAFRAVVASGEGFTFWGLPMQARGGGAAAYFDVSVERLSPDPAGRGGALVVAVEVTSRVEAERGAQDAIAAARRAAEEVRATFEQMVDGVVVCGLDGRSSRRTRPRARSSASAWRAAPRRSRASTARASPTVTRRGAAPRGARPSPTSR